MNSAAEWFADAEQRERVEKKRMSNADRIRQMTDEELAVFLNDIADNCTFSDCNNCPMNGACVDVPISMQEWLKREAKYDAKAEP